MSSNIQNDSPTTSTGLISPFAQATNTPPSNSSTAPLPAESETSLPPRTPQVDSYQISHIAQARSRIKQSFANSPLLSSSNATTTTDDDTDGNSDNSDDDGVEYIFPRFDKSELQLGKVLGSGGFGTVLEITGFRILTERDDDGFDAANTDSSNSGKKNSKKQARRPSRIKCRSYDESELHQSTTTTTTTKHHHRKSPVRNITRGIRTKALSWNARSSGRGVLSDVGHFFHHHHGGNKGVEECGNGGGVEGDLESITTTSTTTTINGLEHHPQPPAEQPTSKQQQQRGPTKQTYVRQISRNFSLKAWRDSDPGEEGNDAISPEEMERYQLEYVWNGQRACINGSGVGGGGGVSSSLSVNDEQEEEEDDETRSNKAAAAEECYNDCNNLNHQADCLVDEVGVCPGTNHYLSTVLETTSDEPVDDNGSQFRVYDTFDYSETDDNADNNNRQSQRRRRIVFFQPTLPQQPQQQDKQYMTNHATTPTGESRYVIKIIQPTIVQTNFKKFLQAAMDMATETKFLSVLRHPHILQMRAVGQGDMFHPEYFIVLDRLYDTLLDRMEGQWKELADHLEHDFLVWSRASKVKMLWAERMGVMRDVAGALGYIHSLGVIYRDIKPENIGFDSKGVVKLFDFGLAKEVRKEDESPNGTYKLTPDTGSLRYMAPEVGNKWPYNFLADSYSFGIMLWEVASLNRPFSMYTPNEIRDMVMKWGERPKVNAVWPDRVKKLMTTAWDSSFRKRPTMEEFHVALEIEVAEALQV